MVTFPFLCVSVSTTVQEIIPDVLIEVFSASSLPPPPPPEKQRALWLAEQLVTEVVRDMSRELIGQLTHQFVEQ